MNFQMSVNLLTCPLETCPASSPKVPVKKENWPPPFARGVHPQPRVPSPLSFYLSIK